MSDSKHVAVFAFPFGCHAKPVLNLVCKLATAIPEALFSFFNTAKSNSTLFSPSQSDFPPNLKAYPVGDGVPASPLDSLNLFLAAAPQNFEMGMKMAVAESGRSISCLVTDGFLMFGADLARNLRIPWIPIWIPFPSALFAHIHTHLIRQSFINEDGTIESTIPGLSGLRISDLPDEVIINGDSEETIFSQMLSQTGRILPRATAIVMNFYQELSPNSLLTQELKSKFHNLFYLGFLTVPLPPLPLPPSDSDRTGCLSWLDGQKTTSVAYISFGTLATPNHEELIAIAEALEASSTTLPFLWSLRDNLVDLLPNGFAERTKKHGKIVPWAPQSQVLGHGSLGVFVTHCGCNSVYESIANGVPMICRPFFGDHRMTAKMVEEVWGVGVRIEGGVFTKSGLVKCFEKILGNPRGKMMKKNAEALKEVIFKAAEPNGTAATDFKSLTNIISL